MKPTIAQCLEVAYCVRNNKRLLWIRVQPTQGGRAESSLGNRAGEIRGNLDPNVRALHEIVGVNRQPVPAILSLHPPSDVVKPGGDDNRGYALRYQCTRDCRHMPVDLDLVEKAMN